MWHNNPDTGEPPRPPVQLLLSCLRNMDDTGCFPICAQSGNQYIMVAYHHTTNTIPIRPFTTKYDRCRLTDNDTIMARLQQQNLPVHTVVLDNEASADYK
jgi:hypothetical protein